MRVLVLTALTLCAGVLVTGASAGPPSGLSPQGRVIWNVEALLRDTFGSRQVCLRGYSPKTKSSDFSIAACRLSFSEMIQHPRIFASPLGSSYRLKESGPTGTAFGNASAVTVNGKSVYCGNAKWLAYARYGFDCFKPL